MAQILKICLFCLNETNDAISTFDRTTHAENARAIINKHFWFDTEEISSSDSYVCLECWNTVKSFHDFYVRVKAIYSRPRNREVVIGKNVEISAISKNVKNEKNEKVIELEIDILDNSIPEATSEEEIQRQNEEEFRDLHSSKLKSIRERYKARARKYKARTIEQIVCYICHKPFKTFESLRRHLLRHDPGSHIFECYLCCKMFPREFLLRHHIKYVHELRGKNLKKESRRVSCPICHKDLAHRKLKYHISAIHEKNQTPKNVEMLKCNTCDKMFKGKYLLLQHQRTHDDRKLSQVQCDICNKWLKNRYILTTHKKSHKQTPKKCPHCNKIKPTEQALRSHISTTHSIPKHKCTICSKSFTRPKSLKEHMSTHTGKSLYNCSYCEQTFNSNANMYTHLKKFHLQQWNLDRAKKTIIQFK